MYRVGSTIAEQYTVEAIAGGGMGLVLILRDGFSGARFAAKTVRDEARSSPAVQDRFQREARTWMNLGRHENLVSALFVREIDERPFLFLEFIDGEDLKVLLERDAPVPLAQVLDWGLQLCSGMAYAHRAEIARGHPGLVHRDLKPSNLFVTRDRVLKVSDFGMAKVYDRALESTAEGIGMGTPHYMPPEQLRDARSADARADIYAAGMVIYELVTGVLPLRADRIENQIYNILNVDPPVASTLNPRVPPELDTVLARCLDKRRERRFASFPDLAEPLASIARSAGQRLEDAGALCPACGLPTTRSPAACPLCGAETTAPGVYRRIASTTLALRRTEAAASPRISDVQVRPRVARTGREVTVSVALVNPGGVARDAVLTTPAVDGAHLVGGERIWEGVVPPCGEDRPVRIEYRLLPEREGTVELPPLRLEWRGAGGRRRSITGPAGPTLGVEFSYHVPLLGRESDLAAFGERLRGLRDEGPGAFLVTGEIGAGRTRLLSEMAEQARREGILVLRGKAVQRGVQPMKPLRDGLLAFSGLAGRTSRPDEILTALVETVARHLGTDPDLVSYLADFLAGVPPTREDTPERVYQRWARLYTALAASQPLLLVLDDLHWSEGETREVLVQSLRRAHEAGAPLLLLASWLGADPDPDVTDRIERLDAAFGDLGKEGVRVDRRVLRAFDEREIERFAEAVFPGNHFEADHPWFPQALADLSDGQPYFLLEILRALRTGGGGLPTVRQVDGVWRLAPDLDEETFRRHVPGAVQDVLLRTLRSLPEDVRSVAELAALLGEEFEVDLLTEVAGGVEAVDRALEELERTDLVLPLDASLRRYRFQHALTASVLAQALESRSPRGARRRHRAIVQAMRRLYGDKGLGRRSVLLGRHLVAAGESEEGFHTLVTGARGLVERQAYPRAWTVLTAAESVLEVEGIEVRDDDRITFLMLRGEVAKVTGRYAEGLQCFRSVVESAVDGKGQEVLPDAYSMMGRIHELRGEYDEALYCYSVGKDLRAEAEDARGMRRSLLNIGRIRLRRGEVRRARDSFEEARREAERTDDRYVVAESSLHLGTLDLNAGRVREARAAFRRSLRIARGLKDRGLVALGLNGLGNAAFRAGRLDRALTYHRRAMAVRRALGDREGLSNSYNNLGAILATRGRDREALSYYERSGALHRILGSRQGLATVLTNVGELLLRQGEVNRAQETLEEAVTIRRELGDPGRLAASLSILGDARRECGDVDGARSAWGEARESARAVEEGPTEAAVLVRLGRLELDSGAAGSVEPLLAMALDRLGEPPDPEVRLEAELLAGDLALSLGDAEGALDAADRAVGTARRMPLTSRALARGLRGRARVRAGHVQSGIRQLRRVVRDLADRGAPAPARVRALLDLARELVISGGRVRPVLDEAATVVEDLACHGRRDSDLREIERLREARPGLRDPATSG